MPREPATDVVRDAEARLGGWSRDRAAIAAAVRARIETRYRGTSRTKALAEVIADERADRHEGQRRDVEQRAWREVVARATGDQAEAAFADVVDLYLDDIAGGFDRALYGGVMLILPRALELLFHSIQRGLRGSDARSSIGGPLAELRELATSATLVFAPTHSSNLDSLLVGVALRRAGLPPCVYAAGKHMYRNPVLARLMGKLGAYRVDRALTARLYKDVLKEYAAELLERGFHSVIFPGATRCRTNEIEAHLKLGLLGMTTASARPVFIVPVTISYQVVLEAPALIRAFLEGRSEQRIAGEARQGKDLVRAARGLARLDQAAVVTFGEAIDPAAQAMTNVADALTRSYRRDTVLFSTQLVARALYDLATDRAGSDEIQVLLRRDPASHAFATREVHAAIRQVIAMIRASRDQGAIDGRIDSTDPASIVATALRAWTACHATPPVRLRDDELIVEDLGLVYFYRNRTSHLPAGDDR